MNIAVIAANGRLGSIFIEEALAAGHTVRAGVRGKHTLKPHSRLEIMQCDATNMNDLHKLLEGQDAVVSALGHVKGSDPNVQTTATKRIVAAMSEMNIKRYIDVTGTGVRFDADKITLIDRLLNAAVSLIDPARVKDGRDHQEVLKKSALEWTTIRVLKLQNISPKPFALTPHGPTKWVVGRQEVARAMLEVLKQHSFVQQAPIISGAKYSD